MNSLLPLLGARLSISRYRFASSLAQGKVVLEVGCGLGYGSNYLAQQGAHAVLAGDIDTRLIALAATRYKRENVRFILLDAVQLPIRDHSVDLVAAFEVIEHVPRYHDLLGECRRVLATGGMFVCSTPNRDVFSGGKNPWYPGHSQEFSASGLRESLSQYFRDVSLFGLYSSFGRKERLLNRMVSRPKTILERRIISTLPAKWTMKIVNLAARILSPELSVVTLSDLDVGFWRDLPADYRIFPLDSESKPPLNLIALAAGSLYA